MADGKFAYHAPGQVRAYNPADNSDTAIEQQPPNQDALTRDVVSSQDRLSGAAGLGLKERGT